MSDPRSRPAAGPRRVRDRAREARLRKRMGGPWRVAIVDGSMRPTIEPGDWLLVDPTTRRWPRRGAIVVFREPETGTLAIKRVAGRPGDWVPFADGWLQLADDEAWLLGDADDAALAAAGEGGAVDSRRYGPVTVDDLVGRAWFRYGPIRRLGRLPGAPAGRDLPARRDPSVPREPDDRATADH